MQGARPISRNSILDFGVDSYSYALTAREFAAQFDIAVFEFAQFEAIWATRVVSHARVSCACIMGERIFRLNWSPIKIVTGASR